MTSTWQQSTLPLQNKTIIVRIKGTEKRMAGTIECCFSSVRWASSAMLLLLLLLLYSSLVSSEPFGAAGLLDYHSFPRYNSSIGHRSKTQHSIEHISEQLENCATGKQLRAKISINTLWDVFVVIQRLSSEIREQMETETPNKLLFQMLRFDSQRNLLGLDDQILWGNDLVEKIEEEYKKLRYLTLNKTNKGETVNTENVLSKLETFLSGEREHSGLSMFEVKQAYLEFVAWNSKTKKAVMSNRPARLLLNFLGYDKDMQYSIKKYEINSSKSIRKTIERLEKEYKLDTAVIENWPLSESKTFVGRALEGLNQFTDGFREHSGLIQSELRQAICEFLLWEPETRKRMLEQTDLKLLIELVRFDADGSLIGFGRGTRAIIRLQNSYKNALKQLKILNTEQ